MSYEPDVKLNGSVAVLTRETAEKSAFIGRQHLLIEAPFKNDHKLYVALSYEPTGVRSTGFEPLNPSECRFYGAPANSKITHVWLYVEAGTQYYNYFASDGAIVRIVKPATFNIIQFKDKSVGNAKYFNPATDKKARFLTGAIKFVASSATGNRLLQLVVYTGAITDEDWYYSATLATAIVASATKRLNISPVLPLNEATTVSTIPIPEWIPMSFVVCVRDSANIDATNDKLELIVTYEQYDMV